MDARRLKALYERQLAGDLKPPVAESVDPRATRAMLRASRPMPGGELRDGDHAAVWLWSDLHLAHELSISTFGRPFRNSARMADELFERWRLAVGPGDTMVCLGDVSLPPLWGTRLERVRNAPGRRKLLVFGNHDVHPARGVHGDGFDDVHGTLYVGGDPPLLLTYMPLRRVPEGCVNVHGHLHDRRMPDPSLHINVSVEQLGYRPAALTSVRRLAGRLVAGGTVGGRTTADQLAEVL